MEASEREVIGKLLQQLEAEERAISRQRRKLHDRLAIFSDESGTWAEQEREISRKRSVLHRQIDALLRKTPDAQSTERTSADLSG